MNLLKLLILADDLGITMYPCGDSVLCVGVYPDRRTAKRFNRAVVKHQATLLRMLRKPVQDGVDITSLDLDSLCEGK